MEARPEPDRPIVAAFDLDGTLTEGHSVIDFAVRVAGRRSLVRATIAGVAGAGVPPARAAFKQAVIGRVVRGRAESEVRAVARSLAQDLVGSRLVARTANQLLVHRALGHECVLVTAALDLYAEEVASLLRLDATIATSVEIVGGRCTGNLIDADLHDERKVERLRGWLGDRESIATVYAYGNTEDDDEMIRYAAATRIRSGGTTVSPAGVGGRSTGGGGSSPDPGRRR